MRIRLLLALLFCVVSPTLLRGQQTGVGNSLSNANDSFFENIGTHWSARGNGWFFNGPGGAATPFGGIDANSGARGGVGFHGGGLSGGFGFSAAQGSSRGIGSTSSMLTIPNGGMGTIIDTNYRPFITQITPVLGESALAAKLRLHGLPRLPLRMEEERPLSNPESTKAKTISVSTRSGSAAASSATRGDSSLAEIRRQQAAADALQAAELAAFVEQAEALLAAGDSSGAASSFAKAALRTEGQARADLQLRARQARGK